MKNIAEFIQQRRLQILVHSCIYYHLNKNIISDKQWDKWARELVDAQQKYPEIAEQVIWHEAFKDFDASTGAFLPITDEWVVRKAQYLLTLFKMNTKDVEITKTKKVEKSKKSTAVKQKSSRKTLF